MSAEESIGFVVREGRKRQTEAPDPRRQEQPLERAVGALLVSVHLVAKFTDVALPLFKRAGAIVTLGPLSSRFFTGKVAPRAGIVVVVTDVAVL